MSRRPDLLRMLYVLQKRFLFISASLSLWFGSDDVLLSCGGTLGRVSFLELEVWVKDREDINSDWLTVDEGLSLEGLLPELASVVRTERRLWSRGDMGPGLDGTLEAAEPELTLCCFSL